MLAKEIPSRPALHWLSSSLPTELYDPRAFIAHAAWLRQASAHCAIFPTAASRRSLDRVSVPVWLIILSDQLPVFALVSHYLTNKLMGREPVPQQPLRVFPITDVSGISRSFPLLSRTGGLVPTCYAPVRHFPPRRASRSTCMCKARRKRSL